MSKATSKNKCQQPVDYAVNGSAQDDDMCQIEFASGLIESSSLNSKSPVKKLDLDNLENTLRYAAGVAMCASLIPNKK